MNKNNNPNRIILILPVIIVLLLALIGTQPATAHFDPPAAHFAVYPDTLIVDGFNWPKAGGSQDWQLIDEPIDITLNIFNSLQAFEDGDNPLYTEMRPTYLVDSEHPDYTYESQVHFELGGIPGGEILPGYFVVMEGSGVTKTHTVANLSVTTVNANEELIFGTADPDQNIEVTYCEAVACFTVFATSDPNGEWGADFSTEISAFVPGYGGLVLYRETGTPDVDGGDLTIIEWSITIPEISAWPEDDRVEGSGWPLGSVVDLTVIDNGVTTYTDSGEMITPSWNPGATWVNFDLPFDLNMGDVISLTDGLITKSHVVTALTVDEVVNEADNTLAGTALPESRVDLSIHEVGGFEFSVYAEVDGSWFSDFDTDPHVPHDLIPGTGIVIIQTDEDGDVTHIERFVPNPRFGVSLVNDWLAIHEFSRNASVSVEIYDAPEGTLMFGPESFPTDGGGNVFIESFQHGIDMVPGMRVVVTDEASGRIKDLELADISLDLFDPENDYLEGTGPEESMLWVDVGNEYDGYSQDVSIDVTGIWSLTLAGTFDITDDMGAQARQFDEDNDATVAELNEAEPQPEPYFSVIPNFQQVHGHHWQFGATLTLEIDDPGNGIGVDYGPFYADVVAAPWDPGTETWVEFNLIEFYPNPIELVKSGNLFRLTDPDSETVKEHVVKPLFVNQVDPVSNTLGGSAEADSDVRVDPNPDADNALWVTANSVGEWSASNPDWNISPYFGGDASQWDEDGDSTQYQIRLPLITASPVHNWINFEDFTHNNLVGIQVYRESTLLFDDSRPTDNDGYTWLDGWEVGLDLDVGDQIVATDDFSGLSKILIIDPITLTDVNLENDFFYGTAPANRSIQVDVGNESDGRGMEIESDTDGNWAANFGTLPPPDGPFDITWDMWPSARLFDDDFDASIAEPGAPYLHVVPYWPEIHGHEWDPDAFVTITVDDDEDLSNGVLYEASKYVWDDSWCGEPCFDLTGILELEPYMIVTMTDGETTRKVVVTDLVITDVDPETDTVSGIATPGQVVQVDIHEIPECVSRFVEVDGSGNWIVDFSVPSDVEDECQANTWDLESTSHGRAIITNIRYWDNGTLAYWPPPIKFIDASINPNPVAVEQFASITATFEGDVTTMEYLVEGLMDWTSFEPEDGAFDTYTPEIGADTFYTTDAAGIFPVLVRACNSRTECTEDIFVGFLVVYDPDGGFVTGGGWIWSPAGAYYPDPPLAGKATFGFVSKYKKGASVPTGQTEFQFKVADLNFHSTSYDWLVVAGKKAIYKGTGTINGNGEYKFMISVIDGDLKGGDGLDKFRIRIWLDENGAEVTVYDNQIDDWPDADPTTALGGGSIVVHKAK